MVNSVFCDVPFLLPTDAPNLHIRNGSKIKIGRFSPTIWCVTYGWYSFDGNRNMLGWYLVSSEDPTFIRPLMDIDLYDCYEIEC